MPIKISNNKNEEIAWLCPEVWELPAQLSALDQWLIENEARLFNGGCAVDIGYAPRPGASGGGGKLSTSTMQRMVSLGMDLYLSEYPAFEEGSRGDA